jgi:GntR family transcriptional regulator
MRKHVPGQPAYMTIAAELREQIKDGRLAPSDKLPSERELSQEWNVSGIVARQAIATLRGEGLVYGVRGKGSFVSERRQLTRVAPQRYRRGKPTTTWREESNRAGQHLEKEHRTVQTQASDNIANRLDIEPGAGVSETEYFLRANGMPVTWSHAWEPLEVTKDTEIEWPEEGPYGHLGIVDRFDKVGHRAIEVEEELVIRMPEPHEAARLEIPTGVPLIEIRQTFRTETRPVEVATILYPADRYKFIYRMPIPENEGTDGT